jgi:hypothetical protein
MQMWNRLRCIEPALEVLMGKIEEGTKVVLRFV